MKWTELKEQLISAEMDKLHIKRNFGMPTYYVIYNDNNKDIKAYTNDSQIFDFFDEPNELDYEKTEDYELALEKHNYAMRKAKKLYQDALDRYSDE